MEGMLLRRIERLREKLNALGRSKDLQDPEVVRISQQLDSLLNKYHTINCFRQLSFW